MTKFIKIINSDLKDNEALNIFYSLKSAKIISGKEYFKFQNENAKSGVHLSEISKRAKIDYIKSLSDDFYKKAKIYISLDNLAEDIYNRSLSNNGSTTFVDTGLPVTTGFLVAGLGAPSITTNSLNQDIIKKYIEDNYEQWFKGTHNSRRYFLGTWLDTRTNTWYIDVSHDAGSKENAINICKQRGEKAYYDMLLGKDVYIEDL